MLRLWSLSLVFLLLSACAMQPPWEQTNPERQAEAYTNRGKGYLEQGRSTKALQDFNKALSVSKNYQPALHNTALALQLQQENQLAEKYFKKAIAAKGETTSARNDYAVFLFQQQRYLEAQKQLEKANQNIYYPSRHEILANLGYVAQQLQQPERAITYFEQSLSLDSSLLSLHQELLELYSAAAKWREALRHWFKLRDANQFSSGDLQLALQAAQQTANQQEEKYVRRLIRDIQ